MMTASFQQGDDFLNVTDQLEPVTLSRPGDSSVEAIECQALRAALRRSEAGAKASLLSESDTIWHLLASELPWPPQPGDAIEDSAGRRWTVLAAARMAATSRWRCRCRNLTLALGLDQVIDIEKALYTKGDGGALVTTWQTWRLGVPAKVQPDRAESDDRHGRRVTTTRVTIFVTEPLELDHNYRVRTPDGTIYRVLGARRAERVDMPMEIDAVHTQPSPGGDQTDE